MKKVTMIDLSPISNHLLKCVIVLRRAKDDRDFETTEVICLPMSQADKLERELIERKEAGYLASVQFGRIYVEKAPNTMYCDQVDEFLAKVDA